MAEEATPEQLLKLLELIDGGLKEDNIEDRASREKRERYEKEKAKAIEKLKGVYCSNAGRVYSVRGEAYVLCNMGNLASNCPHNQRQAFTNIIDFVHEFYVCGNRGLNPGEKQGDIFG